MYLKETLTTGGFMRFFALFELLLVVFAFYGIIKYEGALRALIPMLCLFTVFLVERLQGRMDETEEAKNRLRRYQIEEYKKEEVTEWEL
jgi:hypothetical protein